MIRSISFYFHKGRQKQRRYFKRNFLSLYFYCFYALADLVGSLCCIGFPLFSSSGYNIFRMLDETDDCYITKSFEGGDDSKHYLSRFLYAFFLAMLIAMDVVLTYFFTCFARVVIENLFSGATVEIFFWFVAGVAIALGAFIGILLLMMFQIGSHIGAKNHALGVGDIAYNSANFLLKHGTRLFFLDFFITLYYLIIPAIFTAGWLVLMEMARLNELYYTNMFQGIAYGVALLFMIISPMIFGRYFLTLKMASAYLFEDGADTSAYKVVYPEKEDKKPSEEGVRGHYIEAIPLNESDEATPIEVDTREEDK